MSTSFISTQQIKDLIIEQKFTSTQEIMNCMKNMFADVNISIRERQHVNEMTTMC